MDHIMVSFCDHHDSIFIDWVPYKYKDAQFSSYAQSYFFNLKMWKITSPPQMSCWNIKNPALKKFHFLKTAPYMRILKSLDLNRD